MWLKDFWSLVAVVNFVVFRCWFRVFVCEIWHAPSHLLSCVSLVCWFLCWRISNCGSMLLLVLAIILDGCSTCNFLVSVVSSRSCLLEITFVFLNNKILGFGCSYFLLCCCLGGASLIWRSLFTWFLAGVELKSALLFCIWSCVLVIRSLDLLIWSSC